MKVRFTLEALTHITGIHLYIENHSSEAAVRVVERVFAEAARLGRFPNIGHSGAVAETYEWTIPNLPYVIVYEADASQDQLVILGIFHGARNRRSGISQ
jgi:plasmid stabilization system protein ParE